jgi:hypothetical protein
VPGPDRAAVAEVFADLARLCLSGKASERWVVQKIADVAQDHDHDLDLLQSPLGDLWALDDEWTGGWGRSPAELAGDVRSAGTQQLTAQHP